MEASPVLPWPPNCEVMVDCSVVAVTAVLLSLAAARPGLDTALLLPDSLVSLLTSPEQRLVLEASNLVTSSYKSFIFNILLCLQSVVGLPDPASAPLLVLLGEDEDNRTAVVVVGGEQQQNLLSQIVSMKHKISQTFIM